LGEIQNVFWGFEGLLSAERENPILNEKNSGLGEERSPLYLRGGRL